MAVTITVADVFNDVGGSKPLRTDLDATAQARLLAVATALVEDYAGAAPEVIMNEAAVRFCGWLLEAPADGRITTRDDTFTTRWAANGQRGFLLSGAQDLLRPWHVQSERARAI